MPSNSPYPTSSNVSSWVTPTLTHQPSLHQALPQAKARDLGVIKRDISLEEPNVFSISGQQSPAKTVILTEAQTYSLVKQLLFMVSCFSES